MMHPLVYLPDISLPLSIINGHSYTFNNLKDASQKQVSYNLDLQAQKSLYNSAAGKELVLAESRSPTVVIG